MRLAFPLLTLLAAGALGAGIDPTTVAVVAARGRAGSEELAREFARHRGIPETQVILLDLPASVEGAVDRDAYRVRVRDPLRDRLRSLDLLPADATEPPRLRWLVLCHGLPWRIRAEPGPDGKRTASPRNDAASLDSELALVAEPEGELAGARPNPFFGHAGEPPAARRIVRTARLDGPSAEAVRTALRAGWEAERRGLRGRAYVDLGGPYPSGENWIRGAGELCRRLGFPTEVDTDKATWRDGVRFDAPALVFGWYERRPTGRLAAPGLRLEPGAIAFHLHSFSGDDLRDPRGCWAARFVELGAGLTFGNVEEPYLHLSLRPDLLMAALAQGRPAGEAAWAATPSVSWMGMVLGDPFYRPFARGLADQVADLGQPGLGWACQRAANLEPRVPEREALLWFALQAEPNLANALAWARHRRAAGRPFAADWPELPVAAWREADPGLLREAAGFLEETGMPAEAVQARLGLPRPPPAR